MAQPRRAFRAMMFWGAFLLTIGLFALGVGPFLWERMFGVGVFLQGSPLTHHQEVALCLGPALSLPAFAIGIWSHKWHRIAMWLVALLTFIGTYLCILRTNLNQHSTATAMVLATFQSPLLPLVIVSILVAVFIEYSYRIEQAENMHQVIQPSKTVNHPAL